MNKAHLKTYAPQARKDFIAAVTARANLLGLSETSGVLHVANAQVSGDVAMIAGRAWPKKVSEQRNKLITRMRQQSFGAVVEASAYAWFNRLLALRFMELHDYLGHGRRVLSNPKGGLPEVLEHALELVESGQLSGPSPEKVRELKLGNQDSALYRVLLIAQCNALHQAMPFLFEYIGEETELLLPENLLLSDSVVNKLVQQIPESDWENVEIIGWLYQFYISEKKDQVIGKVVKSEDIPAATQLFTPNWIVQYLVQNSVGRLWLMANPASTLASEWPYYIQPASQTPEVQAQLDALIQTRMDEDGGSLNPETITVLDPACGSGHILVVAYDVLKAIYLELGYQARAIPRLILEKNLYGLDIDDRAAQMAGFALLMKARADDRRLFNEPPKLNVLSLQESKGLDAAALAQAINASGTERVDVAQLRWLIDTFEYAKTFGSLIQIGHQPTPNLRKLLSIVQQSLQTGDLYAQAAAQDVLLLVQQALVLGMQFDAVVANPPYMGSKYHCPVLKKYVEANYKAGRADLYGAFTLRSIELTKQNGFISMITFTSWMFLSSFEQLRKYIFEDAPLALLAQNGRGVWGSDFGTCTYVLQKSVPRSLTGCFLRLFDKQGSVASNEELIRRFHKYPRFTSKTDDFSKIPGSPIAYWLSDAVRRAFSHPPLELITISEGQNKTADNDRFVRMSWEVDILKVGQSKKWLNYAKGGAFRKWFGNLEHVVDWSEEARAHYRKDFSCRIIQETLWYEPGISWTLLAYDQSFRYLPKAATFDMTGSSVFFKNTEDINSVLGFLNSKVCSYLSNITNPTVALQIKNVRDLPVAFESNSSAKINVKKCLEISEHDYCAYETVLDFSISPIIAVTAGAVKSSLESSYEAWVNSNRSAIEEMKILEESNNRIFIENYGLANELTPEVPIDKITLSVNPAYRYGLKITEEEQSLRFRQDSMAEMVSYAIGCMMGRYSLDEPGLIYAHAGNVGFDASRYATFPADADGIVPLTDELWFTDDAASRISEFLLAVWGADTLKENMAWLAESLGKKSTGGASETPDETIRRYLADKFFKDHLQTYKKRPIYWLFSSGKQGAFQALVYLHRYTEGTLARLRAEYVVPLTGKMQARIEQLERDASSASSTAVRNRANKQLESLRKQHRELLAYDEQLRHYADMRIALDLDEGVKVNYGKFGDLLSDVKAIVGTKDED